MLLIATLQHRFVHRYLQVCCEIQFYLLSKFPWLYRCQNQQIKCSSDGVGKGSNWSTPATTLCFQSQCINLYSTIPFPNSPLSRWHCFSQPPRSCYKTIKQVEIFLTTFRIIYNYWPWAKLCTFKRYADVGVFFFSFLMMCLVNASLCDTAAFPPRVQHRHKISLDASQIQDVLYFTFLLMYFVHWDKKRHIFPRRRYFLTFPLSTMLKASQSQGIWMDFDYKVK